MEKGKIMNGYSKGTDAKQQGLFIDGQTVAKGSDEYKRRIWWKNGTDHTHLFVGCLVGLYTMYAMFYYCTFLFHSFILAFMQLHHKNPEMQDVA